MFTIYDKQYYLKLSLKNVGLNNFKKCFFKQHNEQHLCITVASASKVIVQGASM